MHSNEIWCNRGHFCEILELDGGAGGNDIDFNGIEDLIITVGFIDNDGKIIEKIDSEPVNLDIAGVSRYVSISIYVDGEVISDSKCMRILKATYLNEKGKRVKYPLKDIQVKKFKPDVTLEP